MNFRDILGPVGAFQLMEQSRAKPELKGVDDIVSEIDRESEARLKRALKLAMPEAEFRGEESKWSPWKGFCWIVDPLDGTRSYLHNRSDWSISVALYKGEHPILGAVYRPSNAELFTFSNEGPKLNGKPIKADPTNKRILGNYHALQELPEAKYIGSCALGACYVAAGRAGAFVLQSAKIAEWDLAAAKPLAQAAGATFRGKPIEFCKEDPRIPEFIVGTPLLAHQLYQKLYPEW